MTDRRAVRACLLALAAILAAPAAAQVLYKLVDRQGRVTYSDKAPKNFNGTVSILTPDTESNLLPSGRPAEAARPPAQAPGVAEGRRNKREELEKRLRAAQARVEAARKALAEGGDPQQDEMQTIQHRKPPLAAGQSPPNRNCFTTRNPRTGAEVLNCPTRVPNDAYYERQKKLEEELKAAEEELAEAERAYRRGTD